MSRTLLIDAIGTVIGVDGAHLSDDAWAGTRTAWQDALAAFPADTAPVETIVAPGAVPVESMLAQLSIDVTLAALRARAGHLLLLHAAGLAAPDGGVVVLIGPSGQGKTTAARVLGRELGYVSDESVGIATDGTVLPYRKPLSLIEDVRQSKVQRSPTELGLRPLPATRLRLTALVLLDRVTESRAPVLERVDIGEGLTRIAEQASFLGRTSAPLHDLASHIRSVGGAHRLTYSDAETLLPIVRELAKRDPAQRAPRVQTTPTASSEGPSISGVGSAGGDAPHFQRAPFLDALALENGRIAVMVRGDRSTQVVVLDGIAPTIWTAAMRPASLSELVMAAVAAHGLPAGVDAGPLVEAAVDELCSLGVLLPL